MICLQPNSFFRIYVLPSVQVLKKMTGFSVALLAFFSIMPITSSHYIVHYTSSGGMCGDTCGYHGYDYTWCKQSGGNGKDWDYCSLEEGLEASGKKCASSCELWGGSYRYCYLTNGKWHYCALLGRQGFLEYSQENNRCIKRCQAAEGTFQCETIRGTERCSPFRDVTPAGLPCHSNYRCAKYGHSVYRCHTDESGTRWDHCGRKGLEGCVWLHSQSNSSHAETCRLPKSPNGSKIIFRRERQDNMLLLTKTQFQSAVHLIDQIRSVSSLPDSGALAAMRLYKQEGITCKGINYTNVELQVGFANDTIVPIAHVLFSDLLRSAEVLRFAFYASLRSAFYQPAYTIAVSVDEPMLCSTDHQ